jgi:hypothetical protein
MNAVQTTELYFLHYLLLQGFSISVGHLQAKSHLETFKKFFEFAFCR